MDSKQAEQLARFLDYALGRRPEEFGLVPGPDGFFPVAEVLKVAHEEGWRKIRRDHLDTLNYHLNRPVLDIDAHLVRLTDRSRLSVLRSAAELPKLLYIPIRRRAYETVAEHGLRPQGHTGRVVLFADRGLALKVGRRRDAEPVIVTVNVQHAQTLGCTMRPFAESIILAEQIPPACCRLPRPPKITTRRADEAPSIPPAPKTPGSFVLDLEKIGAAPAGGQSPRRSKDWKRERRKARRLKQGRRSDR